MRPGHDRALSHMRPDLLADAGRTGRPAGDRGHGRGSVAEERGEVERDCRASDVLEDGVVRVLGNRGTVGACAHERSDGGKGADDRGKEEDHGRGVHVMGHSLGRLDTRELPLLYSHPLREV